MLPTGYLGSTYLVHREAGLSPWRLLLGLRWCRMW